LNLPRRGERSGLLLRLNQGFDRMQVYSAAVTRAQANSAGLPALAEHQSTLGRGFRLSPRTTGTDGFFIATLTRT
jgi:16S rRNA C967 or C1407 C5-methylase (RsmB/RsmF family)